MVVRLRNDRLEYPLGSILWFAGELKMILLQEALSFQFSDAETSCSLSVLG